VEWYVLAVLALLILLAIRASAADKHIDDLGLDLIDRVKILWPTVKCSEWPEKDGTYKCSGEFFIHPQGIKANKK
jgi:hypothetical protein